MLGIHIDTVFFVDDINSVIGFFFMLGGLYVIGGFSIVSLIMVLGVRWGTQLIILSVSSTASCYGPAYTGAVARTSWRARYYPTKLVTTQRVQT